jgi:tetratricopeptide (TPR) repeat protein
MPMAIDKSKSPLWVRIVVWVLVLGLVAGIGILTVGSVIQTWSAGSRGAEVPEEEAQAIRTEIDNLYQPQVDALQADFDANPEDASKAADLAQMYINWANELAAVNDLTTQFMAQISLSKALEFYEKALELDPGNSDYQAYVDELKAILEPQQ